MRDNERVTLSFRSLEELAAFRPAGEKIRERMEERLRQGFPIRISVSKRRIVGTMVSLDRRVRNAESTLVEWETGKSVH